MSVLGEILLRIDISVVVTDPRGGGTPYIGHTGMCGLYGWVFLGAKYVDMGIVWNLYLQV